MQTFEEFLREKDIPIWDQWIKLAEEWHAQQIEPIVKVWEKLNKSEPLQVVFEDYQKMWHAIKQVAERER